VLQDRIDQDKVVSPKDAQIAKTNPLPGKDSSTAEEETTEEIKEEEEVVEEIITPEEEKAVVIISVGNMFIKFLF